MPISMAFSTARVLSLTPNFERIADTWFLTVPGDLHIAPEISLLLAGGIMLLSVGIIYSNTLHIVFGLLGAVLAFQTGRFCLAKSVSANRWLVEHLSAFIGSGIGAYTAFLAFGGRSMFGELGQWQIVFWIAPGVIGAMASARMSRKYKNGLMVISKIN